MEAEACQRYVIRTQLSDVKTLRKDPILALPGVAVRIGHKILIASTTLSRVKFDLEPKAFQWS